MLSKNNHDSVNPKGFFARASAVVVGVFSPHFVSPESVRRSLDKSRECIERSEKNIEEHKKTQGDCEKTINMKL